MFLKTLNQHNLCTWYILPLIGLNKFNFQKANFIDSYLTKDGRQIAVEVADRNLCPAVFFNKHYKEREKKGDNDLLIFAIPEAWKNDTTLFMSGKYSQMSEHAKQLIRENTGLKYNMIDKEGNKRTDAILLALEKHRVLKERWAEELNVDVRDLEDNELLSAPSERSYIDI